MTTYILRHAPTEYSQNHRVNGDPHVDVPISSEGKRACRRAGLALPINEIATYVVSPFERCQRTAELLTQGTAPITTDARLRELDYGAFEGCEFLRYARWLAEHGPYERPPRAHESQADGVVRMVNALRAVLDHPAPRALVAHGLLVSVLQRSQERPDEPLIDVFLPVAPSLAPLAVTDDELRTLSRRLLDDLGRASRSQRPWRVDLGVFPREVQTALATVNSSASVPRTEDGSTHA